jgi:hypothetical protein
MGEIDAKKIRDLPWLLAGRVGRMMEESLGGKIQPNVVETARAHQLSDGNEG